MVCPGASHLRHDPARGLVPSAARVAAPSLFTREGSMWSLAKVDVRETHLCTRSMRGTHVPPSRALRPRVRVVVELEVEIFPLLEGTCVEELVRDLLLQATAFVLCSSAGCPQPGPRAAKAAASTSCLRCRMPTRRNRCNILSYCHLERSMS